MTTATGMTSAAARPTTTEATARGLPLRRSRGGRLLLSVRETNGGRRYGASYHAGDGDEGNKVRERGEQLTVVGPGFHVLELRRQGACEPEQERGAEDAEGAPVAEDQRGERDEPSAGGHVLAEGVHVPDREEGAAAGRERSRGDN